LDEGFLDDLDHLISLFDIISDHKVF